MTELEKKEKLRLSKYFKPGSINAKEKRLNIKYPKDISEAIQDIRTPQLDEVEMLANEL